MQAKGILLRYLLLDCLVQLGERKAASGLRYLLHEVTLFCTFQRLASSQDCGKMASLTSVLMA